MTRSQKALRLERKSPPEKAEEDGCFGSVHEREDSKGEDKEYAEIVRKQVSATKAKAEEDGVKVLAALTGRCTSTSGPSSDSSSDLLYDNFTTMT
ncbi:hypothetical protein MG293_020332 [Ovis ammon polii]|uniref:Uncharacterized protein n=1 Tax=Ovis ammon polii TaxID=230172 RepID=A0AAD4TP20_OVIAM|nr:hypothetical protein MG293_020332 [Ovis ammon polii]